MAIFLITYGVEDAKGDSQRIEIPVPRGALTLAQIELYAQNLSLLVDPIIAGYITDIALNIAIDTPVALKDVAGALSIAERGALFSFNADGTDYKFGIRLPTFAPTLFSGRAVNTADTDVSAFMGGVTAGLSGGGATPQPSDKWENDLVTLSKAVMSFRK